MAGCVLVIFGAIQCSGDNIPNINLDYQGDGPELFEPDYISTPLYERDLAIRPDGAEIIFTLGNHKQTIRGLVSIAKNKNGWGSKTLLPFSGRYSDIEPFFSADGNFLYFASNRPIDKDSTRSDYNIWKVERLESGWSEPVALDTVINTAGEEYYPSISRNGNLYFTATREGGIGREDIFVSVLEKGKYLVPQALDTTINTAGFEFNAYIHPDENLLVFSSFGRADGFGGGDLYYSTKDEDGNWQEAVNMGELINSEGLDFCPFIDLQNGVFYFTSDRAFKHERQIQSVEELEAEADQLLNGMGNIYRIPMDQLNLNNQ